LIKQYSQTIKHNLVEVIFTSKISSYLSPLMRILVSLGFINFWEGIYNFWGDAEQDKNIFEEKIWINKATNQVQKNLKNYRSGNNLRLAPPTQDYILSLAAGMLLSSNKEDL
jgi:hypothetical protein